MPNILEKLKHILGSKNSPSPHEKELFLRSEQFMDWISWIPGVRMVAASNSLAMYATHSESDIDLFIITTTKRMWIVRTLVLMIATILGVRAKPGDEAGKFCFPFFMTDKNLSLRNIAIEQDIYLAYWIRTLKPLYNKNYIYGRFMKMNQAFCEDTLGVLSDNENTDHAILEENRIFLTRTRRGAFFDTYRIRNPLSPILDFLDHKLGEISKARIIRKIPSENTEGIRVSENMIKLHYDDRRGEIRDRVIGSIEDGLDR